MRYLPTRGYRQLKKLALWRSDPDTSYRQPWCLLISDESCWENESTKLMLLTGNHLQHVLFCIPLPRRTIATAWVCSLVKVLADHPPRRMVPGMLAKHRQPSCSLSIPQSLADLFFGVTELRSYDYPGKQHRVREQMGEAACPSSVPLQMLAQLLESWTDSTSRGPMPLSHIMKAASAFVPSIVSITYLHIVL